MQTTDSDCNSACLSGWVKDRSQDRRRVTKQRIGYMHTLVEVFLIVLSWQQERYEMKAWSFSSDSIQSSSFLQLQLCYKCKDPTMATKSSNLISESNPSNTDDQLNYNPQSISI